MSDNNMPDKNRFDKSNKTFPIKDSYIFMSHCGVSPLYTGALNKAQEIAEDHNRRAALVFIERYDDILGDLRAAASKLLKTSTDNLALVKNTSEGMNMIANGYPFKEGDQIISYTHEYPANFYPWKLQERRGVELVLLPDRNVTGNAPGGSPCGWLMSDLESLVTDRTRIIAVSHAQFTSGYAADLKQLGEFCRSRNIDLVVDVAQSLGAFSIHPEELNIAALATPGWKWLMGPVGVGLMYTSETFRAKISDVNVGAEVMIQGTDYLDHSWNPHHTAKRFEYSTSPISLAAALEVCITELPLRYGPENIRTELFRLQELILNQLDRDRFEPILFEEAHRSPILSVFCKRDGDDPKQIVESLREKGVLLSSRGGYIRFAPHFHNTNEEVERAVSILNSIKI